MNNSQYAAEQIVNMLIKRGWVSTEAYSVNDLMNNISSIITNASISNVAFTSNRPTVSDVTQTTYIFNA